MRAFGGLKLYLRVSIFEAIIKGARKGGKNNNFSTQD